jgi:hypothetical protein
MTKGGSRSKSKKIIILVSSPWFLLFLNSQTFFFFNQEMPDCKCCEVDTVVLGAIKKVTLNG